MVMFAHSLIQAQNTSPHQVPKNIIFKKKWPHHQSYSFLRFLLHCWYSVFFKDNKSWACISFRLFAHSRHVAISTCYHFFTREQARVLRKRHLIFFRHYGLQTSFLIIGAVHRFWPKKIFPLVEGFWKQFFLLLGISSLISFDGR